jgi:[histone H3]-lysine36 N-dimethyltransferase SETMAR
MDNELNRYYIKIRTILEIDPKTIHEELATALGPNAPSYPTVARWAKCFREGREDVNDYPRSGRPVSELTDENIELVRQVIINDPHSTYDEIIAETSLSHGTIERIIHDCLKMKKVTSRWVPHQLTDKQKQQRVKLCRENLAKFQDGSWRLCDIITGDETWIYHRQIHHKSKNASWVGEGESPTTVVRRSKFEPKNLFSIFFKSNGPVLIHCVDEGKTVDHNYYIENCLKPVVKEIWKQRKVAGTKGIKLLHDNARPHIHSDVINYLTEEGINIMPHPPYSPDLAPCDYWLNDYIKRNLTDQPDEKSLARAVSKVMKKIPEEEYKKTFDKLLERMELCINNHGDYFEHLIK